jgi:phospholipid/cholesterol/gamma-HCH transport system substrate-binding protein
MESKVNYALVGVFVLALGALLGAGAIWLGQSSGTKVYTVYQALMRESVAGLNEGAQVKYRGVNVGQVSRIELAPDDPEIVRLLLEVERQTPVNVDTVAILKIQGLTGLAYVELAGGTRDSPPLRRQEGQPYPEIRTGPSLLSRLDSAVTDLFEQLRDTSSAADGLIQNLNQLSSSAGEVLNAENRQAFSQILRHSAQLSATLAQRGDSLDASLRDMQATLAGSAALSAELPGLARELRGSNETLRRTLENVNAMLNDNRGQIQQATTALAQAAQQLSENLQGSGQDLQHFTQAALPETAALLAEMRDLIRQLNQLTQTLQQRPNALVFGHPAAAPGPGEE